MTHRAQVTAVFVVVAAVSAALAAIAAPTASAAVTTGAASAGRPGLPPGIERVCDWSPTQRPTCAALLRTGMPDHIGLYQRGAAPKGYGPADLRAAYRLPAGSLGSGDTVAVVSALGYPKASSDLAVYRRQFGLPPCDTSSNCFRKVNQNGQMNNYPKPDPQFAVSQAFVLDMVSAICPDCKILLVEAIDSFGNLAASVATARRLGALFIVNDYMADDTVANSKFASDFSHPGVVMTAGGCCGYQFTPGVVPNSNGMFLPAAFPKVTAVGMTTLSRAKNGRRFTETAFSGSASGCSDGRDVSWRKPAWQPSTACEGLKPNADVAAVGDTKTGVAIYDTFGPHGWEIGGGPDIASAIIASVYALAGRPSPGTFPASYPYVQSSGLFDIVKGSNLHTTFNNCSPRLLCHAGPGYDGPTGLGTPDGLAAFIPPRQVDYVAMGDSYAAGVGSPPYLRGSDTNKDQCRRSVHAYPTLVTLPGQRVPIATAAKDGDARFAFISCSGAETTSITKAAVFAGSGDEKGWNAHGNTDWGQIQPDLPEGLQAGQPAGLNAATTLVTLTVGGNDARFADVLTGCLIRAARKLLPIQRDCADPKFRLKRTSKKGGAVDPEDLVDFEPKVIMALRVHLVATYQAIHAKAPQAEIVVAGYPQFFKAHPTATCRLNKVGGLLLKFRAGDQKTINTWGTELNASVKAAVDQVRADGVAIKYVDPVPAFAGHELCSRQPWINGVVVIYRGPGGFRAVNPASFHATVVGDEEYGRLISACLAGTLSC